MKKIVRSLIALAIAVGGSISPMTVAQAQPYHGGLYMWLRYYSDSNFENQIGVLYQYCDWWSEGSGGVSIYSLVDYYECP